jgi:hypothetical protein
MHDPDPCEVSAEEALHLHRCLLERDPVAPADFAVAFLKPLIAWLQRTNPSVDPMACGEAAGEAIVRFLTNSTKYDPQRLEMEAFLRMAAQRDLQNLLRKECRVAVPSGDSCARTAKGLFGSLRGRETRSRRSWPRAVTESKPSPKGPSILPMVLARESSLRSRHSLRDRWARG